MLVACGLFALSLCLGVAVRMVRWCGAAAGAAAVVLVLGGAAGCSSGDAGAGASVPQYSPDDGGGVSASAGVGGADGSSAEASAGAGAVATGLTAESLSDSQIEYTMVSVPEGLDPAQSEVLAAFVAYDQATWKAVRDMNGTAQVEATMTGQRLTDFMTNYKDQEAKGQHVEGSASTEVWTVDLMPNDFTASVGTCTDMTKARVVSASGEDHTSEEVPHRFPMTYTLVRSGSGWKVAGSSHGDADQC